MVNFFFSINTVILVMLLAGGAAAIGWARAWRRRSSDDRVDWENMLADCKNLRSRGVLSEDEYRNIRTVVDGRRSSQ